MNHSKTENVNFQMSKLNSVTELDLVFIGWIVYWLNWLVGFLAEVIEAWVFQEPSSLLHNWFHFNGVSLLKLNDSSGVHQIAYSLLSFTQKIQLSWDHRYNVKRRYFTFILLTYTPSWYSLGFLYGHGSGYQKLK